MIIAIDNEYIPADAPMGDTPNARPDVQSVYCEVMQLGACKLDDEGHEIDVLNLTVAPRLLHEIPVWLSNMTGMTAEHRAKGVAFPDVLEQLCDFVGDETVWTFNGDWWVLAGNAKAHGIPFTLKPFQRTKPQLAEFGISLADYERLGFPEMNSGNLYKVLGLTLPTIEGVGAHDAAHDARSLAYSMRYLLSR